jgi:hypothetical protein
MNILEQAQNEVQREEQEKNEQLQHVQKIQADKQQEIKGIATPYLPRVYDLLRELGVGDTLFDLYRVVSTPIELLHTKSQVCQNPGFPEFNTVNVVCGYMIITPYAAPYLTVDSDRQVVLGLVVETVGDIRTWRNPPESFVRWFHLDNVREVEELKKAIIKVVAKVLKRQ